MARHRWNQSSRTYVPTPFEMGIYVPKLCHAHNAVKPLAFGKNQSHRTQLWKYKKSVLKSTPNKQNHQASSSSNSRRMGCTDYFKPSHLGRFNHLFTNRTRNCNEPTQKTQPIRGTQHHYQLHPNAERTLRSMAF